ncbi:MAG: EVE domain-containing protein [Desulfurococcaceae archaeon]
MVNYWFCVTNEDNWNIIKSKHVWGVPKRGRRYVLDVKIGDFLVFYIIPKKIGGIFRAVSEPFESEERIFSWIDYGKDEVFPFRVKIEPFLVPEKALPFDRLIEKLSFTKGLKRWSIKLRRAMFKISEEDFNTIKNLCKWLRTYNV